eukprot:CAMPEP_0175155652 /NCGR_PEP_ID=MMETSP0087-20121206/21117_1 /TAXON_ID=136419 /ORGANISM="Unknown Unknown, Strain D1" /LENGTH=263 /DNA_ID=CAMNT_0016442877 /DNA_START=75 /DNA_END=866 /DNA_ORIENTATION=-
MPSMKPALSGILKNGLVATSGLDYTPALGVHFSSPESTARWGVAHYILVGATGAVAGLCVKAWQRGAPNLKAPGWLTIISSLLSGAAIYPSGYPLMLPAGIAMLFCQREKDDKGKQDPQKNTFPSGFALGVYMKTVAVLHTLYGLSIPIFRQALYDCVSSGVWGTSEIHGIGDYFHTAPTPPGPIWAMSHFFLVGAVWWYTASIIQDWASHKKKVRTAVPALLIVCGMTMGSLSPSSGYWMMVGIGAQLLGTEADRVADNKTE